MDKSLVLVLGLVLYFSSICDAYPVPKKQFLPYRPGYVPVYIRSGDTPLEDINLDLAEAFHSIPSGRSAGRLNDIKAARSQEKQDENGGYIVVKVETPTIAELTSLRKEKSKVAKEESHLEKVEISSESEDVKVKEDNTKPKASFSQSDKKKAIPQKEQSNSKFIQKIPKE
ncbi:uncharacterized protein LOC143911852 [Arctopsyche grandis]|uniref:uncharacterized protein LOC143911852 n=1 Tax=Arctopsyche grandis TaxID=121162 RepID=UPI00406D954F